MEDNVKGAARSNLGGAVLASAGVLGGLYAYSDVMKDLVRKARTFWAGPELPQQDNALVLQDQNTPQQMARSPSRGVGQNTPQRNSEALLSARSSWADDQTGGRGPANFPRSDTMGWGGERDDGEKDNIIIERYSRLRQDMTALEQREEKARKQFVENLQLHQNVFERAIREEIGKLELRQGTFERRLDEKIAKFDEKIAKLRAFLPEE